MAVDALEATADRGWLYHPTIPEHWTPRALHSMARWVNGIAFRDIQFSPTGRPVIKIAEIKGGLSAQTKFTQQSFDEAVRVRPGDLLFSWSGQPETSIDAFWWRGPEGWLNQHVFRVTPEEGIEAVFFYYLLRYLKPNFVGIARNKQTTGLGHVTKRDLENIEVAYPDLNEQRAIAHVLGTLDDKIEVNRQISETLEKIAQVMFNGWFAELEPVRNSAEDLIRKGALEIGDGYRAKNSELSKPGLPFVRAGDLKDGFDTSGADVLHESSVAKAGIKLSRSGDVAFTSKGTIGRFARVTKYTQPFVYSPQICFWRSLQHEDLHPVILYCWMRSGDFLRQIEAVAGQTDMAPYVSLRDQRAMEVPAFPKDQLALGRRLESVLDRQAIALRETATLAALRDALIPKLFSGELPVKHAETFLARVQ